MILMCKTLPNAVRRLASLRRDTRGLAYIEFAYMLPILMTLGLGGIELANMAIAHTKISQVALSLADNASRAKQEVATGLPRMRETDVNQVMRGSMLQGGSLDIPDHGRLILTSLERNANGGQWLHWQRCVGTKPYASSYGKQGDGKTGTAIKGIGPAGRQVAAEDGYAIMFVEVAYDYQPIIFGKMFGPQVIKKTAAMYVRDDRDLSQIYNPSPAAPVSNC